jgi:hypothetical protein
VGNTRSGGGASFHPKSDFEPMALNNDGGRLKLAVVV